MRETEITFPQTIILAPTATNSVAPAAINGVTYFYILFCISLPIAGSLTDLPPLSPVDATNLRTKLR